MNKSEPEKLKQIAVKVGAVSSSKDSPVVKIGCAAIGLYLALTDSFSRKLRSNYANHAEPLGV
ncbi:MAG: hypothetical protein N2489_05715 [Clostridia bacterium]|nr:hypothetical protein [Clostridia bacterium]